MGYKISISDIRKIWKIVKPRDLSCPHVIPMGSYGGCDITSIVHAEASHELGAGNPRWIWTSHTWKQRSKVSLKLEVCWVFL